ncbi:cobalt-precorrin-4/precorrin-4 C(11)-methyltransferase [Rhodococcoides yunnanense]|uniref:cobalt-precorrin-4/precorrin-4 C(11)-methyltransferase n=1 Tax=Rhodococcoides yunnanense TaxID=278209 RepID=UPI000934A049|nr:SAM-dependent methyltransferase [Rhodococcus yunnanensis]
MTVHFIGAGPGAADLLTLRAVDHLRASPVCVYAGTYIDDAILAHCSAGTRMVDTASMDLDAIIAELVAADTRGEDVARLCSGDPSLYSALAEQSARLDAEGIAWDVTPGVPAYAAAAATLRVELTVPELAQSVVLTRAQARSTAMPDGERLSAFAATGSTLVLHLAITRTRLLAEELTGYYGSECPVAVVFHASKPDQLVLTGTLGDIAEQVEAAGLKQAAVILVGPAVGRTPGAESHLYDACRDRA